MLCVSAVQDCGVGGTPCKESREMGVSLKGLKWTNPRPSSLQESIFFSECKMKAIHFRSLHVYFLLASYIGVC